MNKPNLNDSWRIRRSWLFASLLWLAVMISVIVIFKIDSEPARIFTDSGLWGFVTLLSVYVFGAVADDFLKKRN